MADTEPALSRVVALFGLYTFFATQPTLQAPALRSVKHIEIPIGMPIGQPFYWNSSDATTCADLYTSLLTLPQMLTDSLIPLQPHTIYTLSTLVKSQAFHILPATALHALNPRELPREIFVQDGYELSSLKAGPHAVGTSSQAGASQVLEVPPKKKGRPTKKEKQKKAMQALQQVDKWLEKSNATIQPALVSPNGSIGPTALQEMNNNVPPPAPVTTHVLMTHPPTTTLNNYRSKKTQLLDAIGSDPGIYTPRIEQETSSAQEALDRANKAVLTRLKKLDEMAAEKGLEVGGEGGERTGLERVEKAVAELYSGGVSGARGGILGLLEGGGTSAMDASPEASPGGPSK